MYSKHPSLGKRHVLDYQLVFKQSIEECYQAFFSVLASKDSLESPIDTWVYKSSHLLMFYKVVDAILLFVGKDTTFPRNFQGFWEKCRDDDKEKNRRLWDGESRLLNIVVSMMRRRVIYSLMSQWPPNVEEPTRSILF